MKGLIPKKIFKLGMTPKTKLRLKLTLTGIGLIFSKMHNIKAKAYFQSGSNYSGSSLYYNLSLQQKTGRMDIIKHSNITISDSFPQHDSHQQSQD